MNIGIAFYDIDPNNNFLAEMDNTCDYFTVNEFNSKVKCIDNLSLIHLNVRSLKANFINIQRYLDVINFEFDIIAVSESWLNDHDDLTLFCLEGYDIVNMNRINKRGGGVLLYISNRIENSVINCLSHAVEDMFEIVTVELQMDTAKI